MLCHRKYIAPATNYPCPQKRLQSKQTSRSEFLNLDTIDTWGQVILHCRQKGTTLRLVGCLAAPLH